MKRFWNDVTCSASEAAWSRARRGAGCVLLLLAVAPSLWCAQSLKASESAAVQETTPALKPAGDGRGYTLHVSTREVVVEVVARDHKNYPVNDLTQSDFEVFEGAHKSKDGIKTISSFRIVDPATETSDAAEQSKSVVLPLGGRCEIRSTLHYEIAFHPSKWTGGLHSITVTTNRKHVTLSYRKQFYVGVEGPALPPTSKATKRIEPKLMSAACYHPDVPASLLLGAKRVQSEDASKLRYLVTVLPGSEGLAGIDEESRRVQLEYGVCTFSRSGNVLDFWHFSEDHVLSNDDLNATVANGWQESVEVPRSGRPALARFVVLEPKSGNLGTIDLSTSTHTDVDETGDDGNIKDSTRVLVVSGQTIGATRGSTPLGTPMPRKGALCGDVYELPTTTTLLPDDFQVLNAVGAVYTNSLNAPEQILRQGIPGSTPRSEWFGIDYYGEFWTTKEGKYRFVLNADDGADLFIDERRIINNDGIHPPKTVEGSIVLSAGRHTFHMPYFQGPTYVNLILRIQPPDGDLKIFDVRDFKAPSTHVKRDR